VFALPGIVEIVNQAVKCLLCLENEVFIGLSDGVFGDLPDRHVLSSSPD
jgi:hypothetical protein